MSKKQEQPDGTPDMPETPEIEFQIQESGEVSMLEMTYLINSILDYYTDESELDGDDWKKKTGVANRIIPKSIDKEVEKAFISQLKKFQD
ncbi:MAG: hypothetical protein P8J32_03785 [bacterium]|nr:hypothetical protein [bacterium]